MKLTLFNILALIVFLGGSCIDYRSRNDAAVERLRQAFLQEDVDQIYNESSDITRAGLSRDEFVARVKPAVQALKSIDAELSWHRDERGSPERAVYRDDNWSALVLERNGWRAHLTLEWADQFRLCGIMISGDAPDGGGRIFRNCD
jgi:hypothetical protein